jgi:hypothetical protein
VRSNGTSSKHIPTHETGPHQPSAEKQSAHPTITGSPISNETVNTDTTDEPTKTERSEIGEVPKKTSVTSCTDSLSSLDILKNSYKDESEEESQAYKPNAQPALLIRKKNKSGEKTSVFDRLKDVAEKKTSSGNVFERLGMKSSVKSWSGEESKNFKKDNENWQSIGNPHKRVRDEYEEELDQGRVKKVKHHKNNHIFRDKHDFQKAHDFQKNQKRWEERKSWNGHQSGKQHGKGPKYFWKNKKHKV